MQSHKSFECVVCSPWSQEQKQLKVPRPKSQPVLRHNKSGACLQCRQCNLKVCKDCVTKIAPMLVKDRRKLKYPYHSFIDQWEAFSEGRSVDTNSYIGHCCIIRKYRTANVSFNSASYIFLLHFH